MKLSKINPALLISDQNLSNVVGIRKITEDCNSVTFNDLDSNLDGDYILHFSIINGGSNDYFNILFNGDTVATDYRYRNILGDSLQDQNSYLCFLTDSKFGGGFANIKHINGYVFANSISCRENSSDISLLGVVTQKKTQVDKITSITIKALSGRALIKAGSVFRLLKTNSSSLVAPYNPIDVSALTSDYLLKPGEIAYIDYTNTTSVPLNIKTEEGDYEIIIKPTTVLFTATNGNVLLPNNSNTATDAVHRQGYSIANNTIAPITTTSNACYMGYGSIVNLHARVTTTTLQKHMHLSAITSWSGTYCSYDVHSYWTDTTTPWTSLGTVTFPLEQSGKIIIKRIT